MECSETCQVTAGVVSTFTVLACLLLCLSCLLCEQCCMHPRSEPPVATVVAQNPAVPVVSWPPEIKIADEDPV